MKTIKFICIVCPVDGKAFISKKSFSNHNRWHKGIMETARKNIGLAKLGFLNPQWKGNLVKMDGLHEWVKKRFPKPDFCENCHKRKPYDLANRSGKYKRDLSDWEYLCRKCHMEKDGRLNNLHKKRNVVS